MGNWKVGKLESWKDGEIRMNSPTIESINIIQDAVNKLLEKGVDDMFVVAALAQVLLDLAKQTE